MAEGPRTTMAGRVLDARPDTLDFRDRMYEPTLVEVPLELALDDYLDVGVPVLDQGTEGACTGFGLATVAHYLLRRRRVHPDAVEVSPRMLYEIARRHDEWPGEDYSGSSARGAMKGWHRHGVCAATEWPYDPQRPDPDLTAARSEDARLRPLGAYYRVNHQDVVAMHSALAEVGVLFATAIVHSGWEAVGADGHIGPAEDRLGGHAFAIVAYDREGLWIQNSWGEGWGRGGIGHVSYDDWLANGTDAWVARLGAPVTLRRAGSIALARSASGTDAEAVAFADLRPHIISVGNDGRLRESGTYGTSRAEVERIIRDDIPRITEGWAKRRVLLYAHGGLTSEASAVQHVADFRRALLAAEVYPLSFVWRSDAWSTIGNILEDAGRRRRPEGIVDAAKDFMLDRLDDAIEPLARSLGGKALWDEMKENAEAASTPDGAASVALGHVAELARNDDSIELHIAGHSAGSIFLGPALQLLTREGRIARGALRGQDGLGCTVASVQLWAPACTVDFFKRHYLPAFRAGRAERLALVTLTDAIERDDHCKRIYNKSLLYLVSNAFEASPRIPLLRGGEPLLGMQRFVAEDEELTALLAGDTAEWILSPNTASMGAPDAARSTSHGGCDNDPGILQGALARILGAPEAHQRLELHRSASALRERREGFALASGSGRLGARDA